MKRNLILLFSLAWTILPNIFLSSCKDDDPAPKPKISFDAETKTIGEGAGTVEIPLQLDRTAPGDITVRYKLTGTAVEGTTSGADYKVLGKYGETQIAKGATSGAIQLEIKNDALVEGNETVIITIDNIVNDAGQIGSVSVITVTIEDDDLGSKVSFSTATRTVKESDGEIEIDLILDSPAPQDLTVDYEFKYTDLPQGFIPALDSLFAFNNSVSHLSDFYVHGEYGKVAIPSGQTTAKIILRFFSDFIFENDEKIEINLKSVSMGGQVGTTNKTTITVKQEDGKAIALLWNPHTGVDMDMFLWVGEDVSSLDAVLAIAARDATSPQEEIIFIPSTISNGITDELAFGLSYIYYSGTASPLNFKVHFADFTNGVFESEGNREIFEASYTLDNRNPWDTQSGTDPIVVQTFKIVAGQYTDLSAITVPTSGSRVKAYTIPGNIKRDKINMYTPIFQK